MTGVEGIVTASAHNGQHALGQPPPQPQIGSLDNPVPRIGMGHGDQDETSTGVEVLLRNGVWVKKRFAIPRACREACIIYGHSAQFSVELTHRCRVRRQLCQELARIIPSLVNCESMCCFRTLNKEANDHRTCLFEGAKLELILSTNLAQAFGFCFPRTAFVTERERLNMDEILATEETGDWIGWQRHEPTDSDRLRVNRRGWEVLYFVRAPMTEFDVTISDLRSEVCHTLQIGNPQRVAFSAGPFYWGPDFKEDGLALYSNYFGSDLSVDGRHMKTVNGSALLCVHELKEV